MPVVIAVAVWGRSQTLVPRGIKLHIAYDILSPTDHQPPGMEFALRYSMVDCSGSIFICQSHDDCSIAAM